MEDETIDDIILAMEPLSETASKAAISDAAAAPTDASSKGVELAADPTNQPAFPMHTRLPSNVTISAGTPIFSGSQHFPFPSYPNILMHPSVIAVPPSQSHQASSSSTHGVTMTVPFHFHHIIGVVPSRYPLPQDFRYPIVPNTASSIEGAPTNALLASSFPHVGSRTASASESYVLEKDGSSGPSKEDSSAPSDNPSDSPQIQDGNNSLQPFTFSSNIPATPLRVDDSSALPRPSYWSQQQSHMVYSQDPNFASYSVAYQNSNPWDSNTQASATFAMGVPINIEPPSASSSTKSKSRRKKGGAALEVDSSVQASSKTESLPNAHHFLMPATEARKLISTLTWQEKTIYVARHLLGGRTVNGFLQATSMARRYKKRRARQLTRHAINGKKTQIDFDEVEKLLSEESNDQATSDDKISDEATEEVLKKITMNEYMARRLVAEMAFGITYCDTVSSVIESILEEMSPFKRHVAELEKDETSSIQEPLIHTNKKSVSSSTRSTKTNVVPKSNLPTKGNVDVATTVHNLKSTTESIPPTEAYKVAGSADGGDRPGSSHFSTQRSLRGKKRKQTILPPLEDIQSVMNISNKKEKMHRIFDIIRFRPLLAGDFVAVRPTSQDVWILSRVVAEWNLPPTITSMALIDMTIAKRESILSTNRVQVQDYDDCGSKDPATVKSLARSLVLPLPRSIIEGNQWCSFLSKGVRSYAMYPSTTAFYPCTVVDSTTYCQGDNDIVVVEFDGDEDELNVIVSKHIPSRFVTLIPLEYEPSQGVTKKMKKSFTSNVSGKVG